MSRLDSSPTRVFASDAKLVKSHAKNGIMCPMTGSPGREIPTTTPAISEHRPGATSCSSNKIDKKEIRLPDRWACHLNPPVRLGPIRNQKIHSAGYFCPTFASTAKKQAALNHVQPERSCALKLARFWCRTMFATAAAIASCPVRLA